MRSRWIWPYGFTATRAPDKKTGSSPQAAIHGHQPVDPRPDLHLPGSGRTTARHLRRHPEIPGVAELVPQPERPQGAQRELLRFLFRREPAESLPISLRKSTARP
jgi:hypothetical protein